MVPTAPHEDRNGSDNSPDILPAYAAWILANYLDEFTREQLRLAREEKIPLLKHFASFSEAELFKLSQGSNMLLLNMLASNQAGEFIRQSTENFASNRIGSVDRDAVIIEDITLVALVRRRVFRSFLKTYTTDTEVFYSVMEEVDRFTAASEASSFHAYHKIQQENVNEINARLAQQQEDLLEAQSLAEMGSFFWNIKDDTYNYSPGALKIFGFEKSKTRENFMKEVPPVDAARLTAAFEKACNEDGIFECEFSYLLESGEKRIWSRGILQREDGEPASMRGSIRDMTKKYLLLQSLRQSEDLHNQAQALTHIGNWSWDIKSGEILWSDEMYRIYGLEPQSENISFDRFMSLIHPDDRNKRKTAIQKSLRDGVSEDYLLRIVTPAGIEKILKGKSEIIKDINNRPVKINGTCQDITREEKLHQELQEKEQNFRQLIHSAPDAVIVINENNIITLWNPKSASVFGWTVEEAIGRSLSETIIPLESRQAHEQGMKRFLTNGEARILNKTLELTACKKSGEELYISLTVSETMQGGVKAFIAFLRDITAQKQIRLELAKKTSMLEDKNLELERTNQELESFNFIASHDLQEPLRKIQTFCSRITDRNGADLPGPVQKDVEKIRLAASRMQQLINDLLRFAQNTLLQQHRQMVDLNEIVEEVKSAFLLDAEEKEAEIHAELLPAVKVVRFQFLQLFINLLSNSIKYRQPGINLRIHISSALVEGNKTTKPGAMPKDSFLAIKIIDNGIGFEQQYAEKIFDLFARLHGKDEYTGTGIGLATCKKIVHNHDGFITAESKPGEGACFTIYLPDHYVAV